MDGSASARQTASMLFAGVQFRSTDAQMLQEARSCSDAVLHESGHRAFWELKVGTGWGLGRRVARHSRKLRRRCAREEDGIYQSRVLELTARERTSSGIFLSQSPQRTVYLLHVRFLVCADAELKMRKQRSDILLTPLHSNSRDRQCDIKDQSGILCEVIRGNILGERTLRNWHGPLPISPVFPLVPYSGKSGTWDHLEKIHNRNNDS
jgi:hypothetical protein